MVPDAVRQLDAAGVDVVDVAARHATLDDVFFALTGHGAEDQTTRREPAPMSDRRPPSASTLDLAPAPFEDIPRWAGLAVQGQLDRGDAPPARAAPQPRAAGVRHDPADHVRRAVRLRVRRLGDTPIDYTQYVMPGIFAQTVLFNSAFTGVGVADDLSKGIVDRLRSLPMYPARRARSGARCPTSCATCSRSSSCSSSPSLVGFRIEGTLAEALAATALLFAFSYAFSWIQA